MTCITAVSPIRRPGKRFVIQDEGVDAQALFFVDRGQVELRLVPLRAPLPGQLLVRTMFSGISAGTELLAYRGQLDPAMVRDETLGSLGGAFRYPFAYGYSAVGCVERSRSDVAEGTLVFAFHPHQDRFVVDANDVIVLDAAIEARRATWFPLVETALQVVLDCGPVLHEPVVVIGLGEVGILVALLLQRAGAAVLGIEIRPARRELGQALGLPVAAPADAGSLVAELSGGRGAALLVEASGAPDALSSSLDLMAHEGTVLVTSWYGTRSVPLPLGGAFHRRRLTIRSTQVSTIGSAQAVRWDIPRRRSVAAALLAQLPFGSLPALDVPFSEAARAYADLDAGRGDHLHVRLRYE
jgi:2-desacetyl-2-hydroxyethyl bacteriochlorophyllide A dehydrogenase